MSLRQIRKLQQKQPHAIEPLEHTAEEGGEHEQEEEEEVEEEVAQPVKTSKKLNSFELARPPIPH